MHAAPLLAGAQHGVLLFKYRWLCWWQACSAHAANAGLGLESHSCQSTVMWRSWDLQGNVSALVQRMPRGNVRQTMMFSATWPREVRGLAANLLQGSRNPTVHLLLCLKISLVYKLILPDPPGLPAFLVDVPLTCSLLLLSFAKKEPLNTPQTPPYYPLNPLHLNDRPLFSPIMGLQGEEGGGDIGAR
eukprot:1160908-Pelagomonas_calceolata.AAC.11